MLSFSMNSHGVTYHAKKSSREMAHKILKKAHTKNNNAAVFFPKSLSADYSTNQQSSEQNINIKPGERFDFHLLYIERLIVAENGKTYNKAHIVLDFYATSAVSLIGEIASPNYPIAYPDNAHITWLVRVPDGFIVELEIVDLVIEECCDKLTLYDGISDSDVVIDDLTGNFSQLSLKPFQSTGNNLFLRLTSDCSVALGGFSAITRAQLPNNTSTLTNENETSSANHRLNASFEEKILTSPGYPGQHPNHVDTSWQIRAVNFSYVIKLRVIGMDLEYCCDHVFVHDGPTEDSPLLATLSGQVTDVIILSNNDSVYVTFMSDGSVRKMGFQIAYSMVFPADSDPAPTYSTPATHTDVAFTELDDTPGDWTTYSPDPTTSFPGNSTSPNRHLYADLEEKVFFSPGFPRSHPNNINITWSIRAFNKLYAVEINVAHLELEYCCDKLYIYDGPSPSYSLLGSLTGIVSNRSFQSSGNYMFIHFVTDSSVTYQGFEIKYSSLLINRSTCLGNNFQESYFEISAYYGFITVPECYTNHSWHIHNPFQNYRIRLYPAYPVYVKLSDGDEFLFYDGPSKDFRLLAHMEHGDSFPYVYSTSNDLFVEFISRNMSKSEFVFRTYSRFQCPHTRLYAEPYDQYFSSPGYPNFYINMHCSWNIYPRYSNESVEITILDYKGNRFHTLRVYNEHRSEYVPLLSKNNCSLVFSGSYIGVSFSNSQYQETLNGFYAKYRSVPAEKLHALCPSYVNRVSRQNGEQRLYFHYYQEHVSCMYFPSISNTSGISLRLVGTGTLNDANVSIHSKSKGVLANFTDVQDKEDYDLGVYPYPDLFLRAEVDVGLIIKYRNNYGHAHYAHHRYIVIEYKIV
ncbi:unnamed protein product [Clavelina lepadiformis]